MRQNLGYISVKIYTYSYTLCRPILTILFNIRTKDTILGDEHL